MNNFEDQVYRANFKARNGYDPGPYGKMDPITLGFVIFFGIYMLLNWGAK